MSGKFEFKAIDKKQLPQLAVLGVLVLGCIGYVGFQFAGPSDSSKSSNSSIHKEKKESVASVEKTEGSVVAAGIKITQIAVPGYAEVSSPATKRDPFLPQIRMETREQMAANKNKPELPKKSLPSMKAASTIKPVNPYNENSAALPGLDGTVAVRQEAVSVTGVISGDDKVAIVKTENGRHIVRQGQLIDGKYRVKKISEDGAVLVERDRQIKLKLGGQKNAS